jgi:hypothetical protein
LIPLALQYLHTCSWASFWKNGLESGGSSMRRGLESWGKLSKLASKKKSRFCFHAKNSPHSLPMPSKEKYYLLPQ